jgi:hypothetical protein
MGQGILRQSEPRQGGAEKKARPHFSFGGRRIPMPRSRLKRMLFGSSFVALGFLGFLPVLGFWMIPVGLLVLSYDVPAVRRARRRLEVWWHRRKDRKSGGKGS